MSDDDIEESMRYAARKLGFVDGFRDQQRTCLKSFLRGHDVFIALPTGFSKSAVFQAAPLCVDFLRQLGDHGDTTERSLAIVVMPLKSLVADQMSRAKELGINACRSVCRGNSSTDSKAFRGAYGRLGELRVRMKASMPTVAMTATASNDTIRRVVDSLGLRNFVLVKESPEKPNIKHSVFTTKSWDFDTMFKWVLEELKEDGSDTKENNYLLSVKKSCH
ncbi:ATP-dependent helicase SGS1-like [Lytechinus variegatus]|uniref:ATP-dependent helicase SGS1-like n=1 Tax=Lytechinus variegatus TaxID=7654 RepID=UPI001BB131A0|nr:ATP-dependent helicase SGS1-like [Lytechinus variegatus]